METKKAKCTESKPYGSPDQYQNNSYIVTMDNSDSGFHKCKGDSKFKVGVEYEYTIEKKMSNANKEYTIIALPKKDFKPFGQSSQMSIEDFIEREKVKCVTYSMSYAERAMSSGKIVEKQLLPTAKTILDWHITQIDKLIKKG